VASPTAGFLGQGNYASRDNEKRAERRALARLEGPVGLERIQAFEVVKPEPNPEWCHEARMVWVMACNDEAVLHWSSGDWMHLYLACDYLHRALTDPKKHTPSAQAMTVIMETLKALKLSDSAKRSNGILVNRDEVEQDPDDAWLDNIIKGEFGASD
jgi:hypothetical protein